jgi:hypothetical protein
VALSGLSARPDRRQDEVAGLAGEYLATVNARDWARLDDLVAPGLRFHDVDLGVVQDHDGYLAWARIIGESFPGLRVAARGLRVDGDVATLSVFVEDPGEGSTARCRTSASAEGRALRMRVIGQRIVEMWSSYEELGLRCGPAR